MIRYRNELWKVINVAGDAVEVGVAEGYFSADILCWPISFPRVYMVDRWETVPSQKGDASNSQEWHDSNFQSAHARVKEFGDRPVFLRGSSVQMAKLVPDSSLALVYIDGDHSFEGCFQDINAWKHKLVPGGVMAFHDYLNPAYGVRDAVPLFAYLRGKEVHVLEEDRPEDAGAYIIL